MATGPAIPRRPSTQRTRAPVDKRALLESHSLFDSLGAAAIERLASRAVTRVVKRGTTIFSKGDPGSALFAVCYGTVKISVPSMDGRDAVFNLVRGGEIFGEIALLDGQPRTATATASADCELMVIERRDFLPLLKSRPELALKLIELLCARLRQTSEQVEDTIFLDLPERLAKVLLRLTDHASDAGRKVTLTQRELSHLIGMSRESTNKQLRAWESRGWVRLERGGIAILEPDALARVAGQGFLTDRASGRRHSAAIRPDGWKPGLVANARSRQGPREQADKNRRQTDHD
jgi:CRP/FNR family cyclic AMP-dependent transcriptional regulator